MGHPKKRIFGLAVLVGVAALSLGSALWRLQDLFHAPLFSLLLGLGLLLGAVRTPFSVGEAMRLIVVLAALFELPPAQAVMTAAVVLMTAQLRTERAGRWQRLAAAAVEAAVVIPAVSIFTSFVPANSGAVRIIAALLVLWLLRGAFAWTWARWLEGKVIPRDDTLRLALPAYIACGGVHIAVNLVRQGPDFAGAAIMLSAAGVLLYGLRFEFRLQDFLALSVRDADARELRILEVFALGIGARERATPERLRLLCSYCLSIGEEMDLKAGELSALHRAALLHDIGSLAVPDHILSQGGSLSPEDFEKVKIHCRVGAEMVEQMGLDPTVAGIVRAHHERWDGQGYPKGLAGEEIPLGARILAVADSLNALTDERPYRPAFTLDEAVRKITSDQGAAFDPAVVAAMGRLHPNWPSVSLESAKLESFPKPVAGQAPVSPAVRSEFQQQIAAAGLEVHGLLQVARQVGTSLNLPEALSAVSVHLRSLIPCDTVVVFLQKPDCVTAAWAHGVDSELFENLRVPLGAGVSGWVVANTLPLLNADAIKDLKEAVGPAGRPSVLRSALSVPLERAGDLRGAISLYQVKPRGFTEDHMRLMRAVSGKVTAAIENALKYEEAESSAVTDYLTQLPNARSLFAHLDSELARCRRSGGSLAVLVCDLDGFKKVNDTLGHLTGNSLLQRVGSDLKKSCRQYDYVARLGGDEFVVVLPGLSTDGVRDRARELALLAIAAGEQVTGERMVAMSIGPALYPSDGLTAKELLEAADRRMYQSKQRRKARMSQEQSIVSS